jgi:PadR family transcriptional regulator PadR
LPKRQSGPANGDVPADTPVGGGGTGGAGAGQRTGCRVLASLDGLKESPYSPSDSLKQVFPYSHSGRAMPDDRADLLQGTLELLVLKTLSLEPMHGWGIAQRIEQMSRGTFEVSQGSLYPALQRMTKRGWVRSEWRVTENNRRARYYMLTPTGERELVRESKGWERTSTAVNWILGWNGGVV